MKRALQHIVVPAIVPVAFFLVAAMPVETVGCRNRGLMAVTIALLGALAGLGAALKALMGRIRGVPHTQWWMASTLILVIPAVAVVLLTR